MKNLVRNIITAFVLILGINFTYGQQISPMIFGQNAWMPDTIGTQYYGGKIHKLWGAVGQSGARVVRFGGIAPDKNRPTNHQYVKMIDSIRANGMEPIMQVPYHNGQYNATTAAEIVKYVNVTMGKNVKYWIIGNEPNLVYGYTTAAQVAKYIKTYATAMKAVDPTIMTIGPEVAWYDRNIINGLTTPGGADDITGKDANGKYYIDVITFHTYPFKGTQNRNDVITSLTSANGLEANLDELNKRLEACNAFHGRSGATALKTGVTETNVDFQNPANDGLNGVGGNSFVGGQFWAELLGVAMKKGLFLSNFWSIAEGMEIGYIGHKDGKKKPAYYHFQMVAQNFSGTYVDGKDNQANVKSFASKNGNKVTVMVMNQDQNINYNFSLKLSNNAVSTNSSLNININAGIEKEMQGTIDNQSTVVFVFDLNGELIKKIEYKLKGNADVDKAPTVTKYKDDVAGGNGSDTTSTTTSTNEDGQNQTTVAFKTYPNPMTQYFTVEVGTKEANAKLEMYNTIGQLVLSKTLTAENNVVKEKIGLNSGLAAGMYIVKVKAGNEEHKTKMMLAK